MNKQEKSLKKTIRTIMNIFSLLLIVISVLALTMLLVFPKTLLFLFEILKSDVLTLWAINYPLAWIVSIIEAIPFFNMIFPGAIIIVAIAWVVAQIDYRGIVAIVIIWNIIWDTFAYWLWIKKGNKRLNSYAESFWLKQEKLEKAKKALAKNDSLAILASKRSNYTRGIIPFFSGMSHTSWKKFLLLNVIWSTIYGLTIVRLAKIFLGNYEIVMRYIRIIAIIVIVAVAIWYLFLFLSDKKKAQNSLSTKNTNEEDN